MTIFSEGILAFSNPLITKSTTSLRVPPILPGLAFTFIPIMSLWSTSESHAVLISFFFGKL